MIILEVNLFEYGYTRQSIQGGGFVIGENVTVTTTIAGDGFDAANIANGLTYSANSPSVSSFVGKIKGLSNNHTLQVTGTGTLNIVGNLFSGTDNGAVGVVNITNNATVNITGNLAYFGGNRALNVQSSCTNAQVTITGDVYIGSFIWGGHQTIVFAGAGTLNIIGTINTSINTQGNGNYPVYLTPPTGLIINFNHTGSMTSTSGTMNGPAGCVFKSYTGLHFC